MSSAATIRAGGAEVEIGGNLSPLEKALQAAQKKVQEWGKDLMKVGAVIAASGAAIVAPMSAAANQFVEVGSSLARIARISGITVETLSGLRSAVDVESLNRGLQHTQEFMLNASRGSEEATSSLRRMGLTFAQLSSATPEQRLRLISEGLASISDSGERLAVAGKVFGGGDALNLSALYQRAGAIDEILQRASGMGVGMTGADAEEARALSRAWKSTAAVIESVWIQIGAAAAPVLRGITDAIRQVVIPVSAWIRENRALFTTIFAVGMALAAAGTAIATMGGMLAAAGAAITFIGPAISAIVAAVSALIPVLGFAAAAIGIVIAGVAGFTMMWGIPIVLAAVAMRALYVRGVLQQVFAHIAGVFRQTYEVARTVANALLGPWLSVWRLISGSTGGILAAIGEQISGLYSEYIAPTFSRIGSIVSGTATRIWGSMTEAFGVIGNTAMTTWAAMRDAFNAGEWSLIWEIIKAGAELAWAQVKMFGEIAFIELKSAALSILDELGAAIVEIYSDVWAAVKANFVVAWSEMKALALETLASLADVAGRFAPTQGLRDAAQEQARGLRLDARREREIIRPQSLQAQDAEAMTGWFDRQLQLVMLQAEVEQDRADAIVAATSAGMAESGAAQGRLDALSNDAFIAREIADRQRWLDSLGTESGNPPGFTQTAGGVMGTFGGAGIEAFLNVGGPAERTAAATEETRDILRRMEADRGGPAREEDVVAE